MCASTKSVAAYRGLVLLALPLSRRFATLRTWLGHVDTPYGNRLHSGTETRARTQYLQSLYGSRVPSLPERIEVEMHRSDAIGSEDGPCENDWQGSGERQSDMALLRGTPQNRPVFEPFCRARRDLDVGSVQSSIQILFAVLTDLAPPFWRNGRFELRHSAEEPIGHGDVFESHHDVAAKHLHQTVVSGPSGQSIDFEAFVPVLDGAANTQCVSVLLKSCRDLCNRSTFSLSPNEGGGLAETLWFHAQVARAKSRVGHGVNTIRDCRKVGLDGFFGSKGPAKVPNSTAKRLGH
jgi:hypothetical protein